MNGLLFWFRTLHIRLAACFCIIALLPFVVLLGLASLLIVLFHPSAITITKPETEKERAQRESAELYSIWEQSKDR